MILIKNIPALRQQLSFLRENKGTIGFVPTMGALHEGHIALIQKSKRESNITVCSIFINPTQFNNAEDLQKYPVTLEKDIDLLEKAGCDVLFLPSVSEMYPAGEKLRHYNLGYSETILEGRYRPGHFQGVCIIVDKLLAAVLPDTLYLGRKDYQQCMVIGKMIKERKYNIALQICDTVREKDGLAMSSRNMRLNAEGRKKATRIFECLQMIKREMKTGDLSSLKESATIFLETNGFKPDYTEIADAQTLEPITDWNGDQKAVALIAAWLNDVRLIDNIIL